MSESVEDIKKKPAKDVLRAVVDMVYQNAWDAKKRGEPVGWSSSKFPAEICETLGLAVCYPENQAAAISAKHGGQRMCEAAEALGYANDICGYARISLAFASGAECEEKPMPQPDFLLCCNNICNCMTKWYENIARMRSIPLIMIDIPYNNEKTVSETRVAYIRGQFDYAIERLEQISGRKWDEKRFEEVCKNANRTARAWLKACSYCQYRPSPLSGFDLFNHMADVVTARCRPEAAEAFEMLAEEYEESVKNGTSTWRYEERYRIMFEGIPCWPNLQSLFKPLKNHGINTTAVVYAPAFGFVYDGMNEMARAYCKAPNSVCIETGVEWREGICRENKVDGVLVHYNRSCKPWSGYMQEMERRFRKDLDVPVVGFDGDQADPRNFSDAQYQTRVEGLFELMEEKAARKGGIQK
ncbi:(R)-phenyllactyl-CoA dehydratase alpha subunit [bioreactor metagenome]|uniref:(R)-phenyllactyl-CoA dehydratase alpha subunit n=1 Tax=bioreactor metagenome TaxID=1076179 RepID=A0A644WWG7_9ZZZZ